MHTRRLLVLIGIVLGLAALSPRTETSFAQEGERVEYDVLLLIDITASMQGQGAGAQNIWPQVADSVLDLIDRLGDGTNVAIVPFDAGPRWASIYPGPVAPGAGVDPAVLGPADSRNLVKAHVAFMPVDGLETHIYESVEYALQQLRRWREATPDVERRQSLIIYTDGLDNGPHAAAGVPGLADLFKAYQDRSAPTYVVYNDLSSFLEEPERQLLQGAGVTIASGLPKANVALDTLTLDLGEMGPGASVTKPVRFSSSFGDVFGQPVRISLQGAPQGLSVSPAETALAKSLDLTFSLAGVETSTETTARVVIEPATEAFNIVPRNVVDVRVRLAAATPEPEPEPEPRDDGGASVPEIPWATVAVAAAAAGALVLAGGLVWLLLLARRRQWGPFKQPDVFHRVMYKEGSPPRSFAELGVHIVPLKARRGANRWVVGIGEAHVALPARDGVRPRHAVVELRKKGGVFLVPLEGDVLMDDRPLPSSGRRLEPGASFRIGPYHFRYDVIEA